MQPDIMKIGMTSSSLNKRLSQLSTASILPFFPVVEIRFKFTDKFVKQPDQKIVCDFYKYKNNLHIKQHDFISDEYHHKSPSDNSDEYVNYINTQDVHKFTMSFEKHIHKMFDKNRVVRNREFFFVKEHELLDTLIYKDIVQDFMKNSCTLSGIMNDRLNILYHVYSRYI